MPDVALWEADAGRSGDQEIETILANMAYKNLRTQWADTEVDGRHEEHISERRHKWLVIESPPAENHAEWCPTDSWWNDVESGQSNQRRVRPPAQFQGKTISLLTSPSSESCFYSIKPCIHSPSPRVIQFFQYTKARNPKIQKALCPCDKLLPLLWPLTPPSLLLPYIQTPLNYPFVPLTQQ
ncbi:hypothetical protein AAY473_039623, partial [Plecturocebus cupreus]